MKDRVSPKILLKKKIYQKLRYHFLNRHVFALTSQLRVTPDFLIIGAKRCGTTSLYEHLGNHPCIKKSIYDHIGFFDDNYHLGKNFYKSFFITKFEKKYLEKKFGKCITYDVTSSYIQKSVTASRVFEMFPKIKIIAILRNPIDRAYSEYNSHSRVNKTIATFESYIENEIIRIENGSDEYYDNLEERSYLSKGFYFKQLKPWFDLFPKENILILSTEEFDQNTENVFNKIFNFLDIKEFSIVNAKKMEKGKYPNLNIETREKLSKFYRLRNLELYQLIGKDFMWN